MQARFTISILLAAALAAPAAAAGWSGKGSFEPSTTRDRADGWMFLDPDQSPTGNRVYFNGYVTDGSVVITPESPNFALVQSQVATASPQPVAILGVWKDCNKDGYIGNVDNVGFEYRAELLLGDTSLCPPLPGQRLAHNDGAWVHEFFPLTWANKTAIERNGNPDPFNMWDNAVRVWGDQGRPTDPTTLPCHLFPQPAGTFHGTGGMIGWIDCQDDYLVTGTLNVVQDQTGLPIGFSDVEPGDNANSESLLNRPFPLGESSDASYVDAFDCSAPAATVPGQRVSDPTDPGDGSGSLHRVPLPTGGGVNLTDARGDFAATPAENVYGPAASPGVNPDGSVLGTENKTETATFNQCNDPTGVRATGGEDFGGFFWPGTTTRADHAYCPENMADFFVYFKQPAYACEVPYPTTHAGRIRPDFEFFSNGPGSRGAQYRPTSPENASATTPATDLVNQTLATGSQTVLALEYGAGMLVSQVWQTFDKAEFHWGANRQFQPAPAQHLTYYAYVPVSAVATYGLILPKGVVTGAYGADGCAATAVDGLARFNCDRNQWWKDADGNDIPIPNEVDFHQQESVAGHWQIGDPRTFLDDPFNLRDVDCYDESVGPLRDAGLTPQQLFSTGCD